MIDNDTLVEEQVQQSSQEQSEETTQQAAQPGNGVPKYTAAARRRGLPDRT